MIITEFMENGALDAFLRVRKAEHPHWQGGVHYGLLVWEEVTLPIP